VQKWIVMQNRIVSALPMLLPGRRTQRSGLLATGLLVVLILTGCESTAGRVLCGWACGGAGVTMIDEARYKPDDKGRWPAYSDCLGETKGRDAFDVCMSERGYARAAK
jgi:hypothetical protein